MASSDDHRPESPKNPGPPETPGDPKSGGDPQTEGTPEVTPGQKGRSTDTELLADPDRELVEIARTGDERAFEELVLRHQDAVYSRVYYMVHDRHLAEDLAQETFLRAYFGLRNFRGEARFSSWLRRIVMNVTLHWFERRKALKRSGPEFSIDGQRDLEGDAFEIPDEQYRPDHEVLRDEKKRRILEEMAQLPAEFRLTLTLREIEGSSYLEIADQLDLPIGTVKSQIFRARQILQDRLKDIL